MHTLSSLQKLRTTYIPKLPKILQDFAYLNAVASSIQTAKVHPLVAESFPKTCAQPSLTVEKGEAEHRALRVGVVFSGGQAAGGHNVIIGLFDALQLLHKQSCLFGFSNGPQGIVNGHYRVLSQELLQNYRNQGGFDLIGSGRTKIDTPEQFQGALNTVRTLELDGLVIIGGDDSNTNAAYLAEYFLQQGCKTCVVGVPKTIDGDLKNEDIEISFGFDTASKVYTEIIGNLLRDALSAKKSYFFVKVMGRSASHLALECALKTHPNMVLISEELAASHSHLDRIVQEMCDLICQRSQLGKDYGLFLIPEGVVEFLPAFAVLIKELNALLSLENPFYKELEKFYSITDKIAYVKSHLKDNAAACFKKIPTEIQAQLLLDRDPHGNVQVAKIETERLFMEMVKQELKDRTDKGAYSGHFSGQPFYCGYEGRSGFPSNFDAHYCNALGYVAALLIKSKVTGYMCCVQELAKPVSEWTISGIPLVSMMGIEERHGKQRPVIRKAFVDLQGAPYLALKEQRERWKLNDEYCYPGPMQFYGPAEINEMITETLILENQK